MSKPRIDWWIFPTVGMALAAVLSMAYLGGFGGIDRYVYDLFFRIRGESVPDSRIVIVAIDEKTLRNLGAWPIKRRYYADLMKRLHPAEAVGLNVILAEASDDDARLTALRQLSCPVFLPIYIDREAGIVSPNPALSGFPTGHIHVEHDIDGVVRNLFHTIYHDHRQLPSFAAALFNALPDREFHHSGRPGPEEDDPTGVRIRQTDPMGINFYGGSGIFQQVSFIDVITDRVSPSFFQNRTVLVGLTTAGLENGFLTPFSNDRALLSGVEVHATILNNLLDGTFIKPFDDLATALWGLFPAAVGFLVFLRFGAGQAALIWIGGLSAVMVAGFSLFSIQNVWLPPGAINAELTIAFISAYIVKLRQMGQMLAEAKRDWEKSFDTIDDGIAIYDGDGRMIRLNRAAQKHLNTPMTAILQERCTEAVRNASTPKKKDEKEARALGEMGVFEEIHEPETDRHFEVRSLLCVDRSGRLDRVVQVTRDVTDRKGAETKQRMLQARLAQARKMEAIGTLAGGIAHDFNNILAAIMGYTQLAASDLPAESSARAQLDQVLKASRRASDLIYQILAFSRGVRQAPRIFEMGLIVKEALKLIRSTLPARIEIRQEIRSRGMISADPTQIHQIVMNICTNAFHAMRETGGTLTVILDEVTLSGTSEPGSPEHEPGEYLRLSVSDTGHGISEELRSRIFEPYFTTKSQGDGTGLGLATVHGIVENHHGWIDVESAPGKGSAFHIYFPQYRHDEDD